MTPKTEAMQKQVTELKQMIGEFGRAREADDDDAADTIFGSIVEKIEVVILQTIADIPPKEIIKEVAVPAPFQGGGLQVPEVPAVKPQGMERFVPSFLKKK